MPLTTQQVADTEALLLVWYETLREIREEGPEHPDLPGEGRPMKVAHQPSGEQLRLWVDLYGFDCTEFGLRKGIRSFLKNKEIKGFVLTDKEAIWMINYLNVVIKGTKASFENARAPAGTVLRKNFPSRIDYAEACYKAGIQPEARKPWKEKDDQAAA